MWKSVATPKGSFDGGLRVGNHATYLNIIEYSIARYLIS